MDLTLIVFLSLVFPLATIYSYVRFKKRKTAGKEIASRSGCADGAERRIRLPLTAGTKKRWYRILATFMVPEPVTGCEPHLHRYRLVITSEKGRVLFSEERSMTEFFKFCWHEETLQQKQRAARCLCDPILLDFIPPSSGKATIDFLLQEKEQDSELQEFSLHIREGVWPLRQKPYSHSVVDLRKIEEAADDDDPVSLQGEQP